MSKMIYYKAYWIGWTYQVCLIFFVYDYIEFGVKMWYDLDKFIYDFN